MKLRLGAIGCLAVVLHLPPAGFADDKLVVPNGGFEVVNSANKLPDGWRTSFGKGVKATIDVDATVAHSGQRSLRITDQSPTAAYIYAQIASPKIAVKPSTTYLLKLFAKGKNAGKAYVDAAFDGAGKAREALPVGNYDWTEVTIRVTTPADCKSVAIDFSADGVTETLWIDDVTLSVSPLQLGNITERRYPKGFPGMFPRTPGQVPEHLHLVDASGSEADSMLLVALQGIVNRKGPRLYLINRTNPAHYDEVWLKYMQEKGYTGTEERIPDSRAAIRRFRNEITGLIVYDPNLPASRNAAWMLAGLKNALPASPQTAAKLDLPVVEDLRGKWKRNVDAYRYIYDHYWDKMCHHLLAWEYPSRWQEYSSRDYEVQWNVFCFWLSSYGDHEKGADPPAEKQFIEELLAATPGNVPVMGWMSSNGGVGIQEYSGARLLSEYGKWIPGTGFNSNVSVHSAIHPPDSVFKQKYRRQPPQTTLRKDKIYISVNVIDSGDAQWYWQFYQRKIWADPVRGSVPIGFTMNFTIRDMLPLVAQWYYENATPNDTLFGYLYMNAPVYATRFREEDRERIWKEYVAYHDDYCRKMDIDGIELYNGGGGPTAKDDLLRRFTGGMKNLNYILSDFGRHSNINPGNANYLLDDTVVFHTLTQFKVWGPSANVERRDMTQENAWLLDEIRKHSPTGRPGFMAVQAASWYYYPAWFKDLQEKLPRDYVLVSPHEMARLYRESLHWGSGVAR